MKQDLTEYIKILKRDMQAMKDEKKPIYEGHAQYKAGRISAIDDIIRDLQKILDGEV